MRLQPYDVSVSGLGYVGGVRAASLAETLERTGPDHVVIELVRVRCDRSRIDGDYPGRSW